MSEQQTHGHPYPLPTWAPGDVAFYTDVQQFMAHDAIGAAVEAGVRPRRLDLALASPMVRRAFEAMFPLAQPAPPQPPLRAA